MRQRLGIAQVLLNEPKLLICDEPTSALDPVGRKEILDILSSVKEQTTILFSTHIYLMWCVSVTKLLFWIMEKSCCLDQWTN